MTPAPLRRFAAPLLFCFLPPALFLCIVISLLCGAEPFSLERLIRFTEWDAFDTILILDIRLPRTILALVAGMLLAGAGGVYQGFFRNGLADPGLMGISAGATLGAAIASGFLPRAVSLFAFCGALGTVFFAYLIAGAGRQQRNSVTLLLAGSALSAFFSAITSIMILLKDRELYKIYLWTLGSFNGKGWQDLLPLVIPALISIVLFFVCARPLDVLAAGELSSQSMGLNLNLYRPLIMCAGALATATAVSAAGTIGFIGLVAPHMARSLFGPVHKRLIGTGMIIGGILLLAADCIARTAAAPAEIPVGVVTALIGTPFFLYLLLKKGGSSER